MKDLLNKGMDFVRSIRDKAYDKLSNSENEENSFDISENKKIKKHHILGVAKYGESGTGGCFKSYSLQNGSLIISAEGDKNTKQGREGARLAIRSIASVIRRIDGVMYNEERFLKRITSDAFENLVASLWKELVSASYEEASIEENDKSEDIYKDYQASVTYVVITENYYTVGKLGNDSSLLFNEFEGQRTENNDKFTFKSYSTRDFSGIILCSRDFDKALDNKLYDYARMLEGKLKDKEAEFKLDSEIESACRENGLFVVLAYNTEFVMSTEKYKVYKEHIYQQQREEAEKNKREAILRGVERSKDKTLYEIYDHTEYNETSVFKALRQGRSHISRQIPCQDYCMSDNVSKGIVLVDSDGLGSCERSHIGSRFACEATIGLIKFLDAQSESEEIFVERLQSLLFRERLANRWLGMVVDHIRENPFDTEGKGYLEYASTLMMAVITENYYIVGCLGDGQILLYNKNQGLRLRMHSQKEDTSTKSLVNHNWSREDFIVGKYSRKEFSGVLLSTDGMYDGTLSYGDNMHRYAKEIEKRFLENKEPLQPFCYTNENGEIMDLCSSRTMDDCSIVIAIDRDFNFQESKVECLRDKFQIIALETVKNDIYTYYARDEKGEYRIIATKGENKKYEINNIFIEKPLYSIYENGYTLNVYSGSEHPTLEQLYHYGALGEKNEKKPNSSYFTLEVYENIKRIEKELQKYGYGLRKEAEGLMLYDKERGILLYSEAIIKGESQFNCYFDALLGYIECNEIKYPIFTVGFRSRGQKKYMSYDVDGPAFAIVSKNDRLYIENQASDAWTTIDGEKIKSGECLPLENGCIFKVDGRLCKIVLR